MGPGSDRAHFGPGSIRYLVHADAGWLALGREWLDAENAKAHLLFSRDGRTWSEVKTAPDRLDGLSSDGRRFVSIAAKFDDEPGPLDVLVSDDASEWSTAHVADLEKYEGAIAIAGTTSGFAIGGQRFEVTDESSHPIGWTSNRRHILGNI